MKLVFRILGSLSVFASLLICSMAIQVFEKEIEAFPSKWNYWILELLLLGLILLSLIFGWFLYRPNLKRTKQLLWTTVFVLITAIFISSESKKETKRSIIMAGIPVILTGVFSSFVVKKDQSVLYYEFQSKLNC